MGIEGMDNLKPEDEEALDAFRRRLGIDPPKSRAYLIDRDLSRCSMLRNSIPYQNGIEYEVVLRKAEGISNIAFWDRDIVIVGDPLGSADIERDLIRASTLQHKQLRLIGPRIYEVKPIQP